jgi:hypothetical protein
MGPVMNLILPTKSDETIEGFSYIKPRLTANSTILRCQDGFYVWEDLCRIVFPDPTTRPTFIPAAIPWVPFTYPYAFSFEQQLAVNPNPPTWL